MAQRGLENKTGRRLSDLVSPFGTSEQYTREEKIWEQKGLEQRVISAISDMRGYVDIVLDDPRYQRKHVDIIFDYFDPTTNDHREAVTGDIKCDATATRTGNLFYELEVKRRDNGLCLPGSHEACEVDYILAFVPAKTVEEMNAAKQGFDEVEGRLYFIRLPQWRELVHSQKWLDTHRIELATTNRDRERKTTGFPTPLELMKREGLIDKEFDLPPRPFTRELSAKLLESKATARVSTLAECLFIRMLLMADDAGRLWADSEVIKAHAARLRDEITVENIPSLLDELEHEGLIVLYQGTANYDDGVAKDIPLLAFPGWLMYQKQKWPKPSIYSAPPPSKGRARKRR